MSVRSWFLVDGAGPGPRAHPGAGEPPSAGRVAVLLDVRAREPGLGAILGLALAREARAPAVLVLGWRTWAPAHAAVPAAPAGRRLARALRLRELRARASGRLVWVDLPEADDEAAAAVARAVAAAPAEMPVVVALGGPRGAALDALLAEADLVVVPGAGDDPRGRAALAGVATVSDRAVPWPRTPGPPWRRLAHAGVWGGPGAGLPAGARR